MRQLARRIRKRLAPWIEWQRFQCLTLPWQEAEHRRAALPAAPPGIAVRRIDRPELERLAQDPANDISAAFLRTLQGRDDLCFGAFAGPRLAAYGFFAHAPTAIDPHLRFVFDESWVYIYKAFTRPDWRGRRLWPQVLLSALPELHAWRNGRVALAGLVTLVLADNPPSLRAFARLGFRRQAQMPVLRLRRRALVLAERPHPHYRIESPRPALA